MGLVSATKNSHHGTEEYQASRSGSSLLLPIFAGNFTGHGVVREEFMSGLHIDSNTGRTPYNSTAGTGEEGWGIHPNDTVDCLNPRAMMRWVLGMDTDGWEHLWRSEATPGELKASPALGHLSLLRRIVTTVKIQRASGSFFIPNPDEWCMMVSVGLDKINNAYAVPVPRPRTDPGGARLYRKLMSKRAFTLKNCMEK